MKKKGALKIKANKKTAVKPEVAKKKFQCHICHKSGFSDSFTYKTHLFQHKAIPARYKCNYCSKEYYRSDEYSRHISTHKKNKKLHYCDHCDRGFVDKRNLILHLNIHDDLHGFCKLRYKCAACEVTYCEERLLKYHIRKEHLNLNSTEPIHVTKKLNDTWIENVKDTKSCVQITKVKLNTLIIERSKIKCKKDAKHNEEKNVLQQYIASVFATKDNNYSKAICDYCGKEMLKKSLVGHIRERHLKLRRFHCDVCNRTFMRHYQLCLHVCGRDRRRKRKVEKIL